MSPLTRDCPDYSQADADRLVAEGHKWLAEQRRLKAERVCTCRDSPFGMDVDRCPLHGA